MTNLDRIIVTNKPVNINLEGVMVVELIGGWKAYSPTIAPGLGGDVRVDIEGSFNTFDLKRVNGENIWTPATVDEDCKRTMSYELFTWWRSSEFHPTALLLLLLQNGKPKTDDLEIYCESLNENGMNAVDFVLGIIIPGVCACGSPLKVLAAYHEVLSAFNYNPFQWNRDIDVTASGYHLAMAYQLDAVGDLIEHGSGIGSSWLEVRGIILCLAIALILEGTKENAK